MGNKTQQEFQIVNENGSFFSVTMTGQPTFKPSKEFGYVYDKERAEEVVTELIRQGYNVKLIPYIK